MGLTKRDLVKGKTIFESCGAFNKTSGIAYKLLEPLGIPLSFIPDCDNETDDHELNCRVYVIQRWSMENKETKQISARNVEAYLGRWNSVWIKYNYIVSTPDIYEEEVFPD